jgi:hypothetical protein
MAQTLFRSDDTDKWNYKYGDYSGGDETIATDTTDAPIDSACTATIDTNSVSATNVSFSAGKNIFIIQMHGTGAGNCELNKIQSYTDGTITTVKKTKHEYVTGAQVIVIPQVKNFSVADGKTLTGKSWNGTVGGVVVRMGKKCSGPGFVKINGSTGSYVTTDGYSPTTAGGGFRGGRSELNNGDSIGNSGEGYPGSDSTGSAANGNGGGAGNGRLDNGYYNSGGGAGYAGNGIAGLCSPNGTLGAAGLGAGVVSLVTIHLGAGGGGAAMSTSSTSNAYCAGAGGSGGGIIFLIFEEFDTTNKIQLQVNGGNGGMGSGGSNNDGAGGGAGAGGSILIKTAKNLDMGTNIWTALGATGGNSTSGYVGGNSSVGRIHIDHAGTITGTTTPMYDETLDVTIKPASSGGRVVNFM